MDAQCRIELLGDLKVRQGERVITRFRTRQTGALLAYLAYHLGRHLSREVVIEALWPNVEARTGRNNLSIALNSLRSQLEPPGVPAGAVLLSDRFSVSLNPSAILTDVAEFLAALQAAETANEDAARNAALRQAIDLYHGELLPGFYDEWVMQERHRLQALYEQAQEGLNHRAPDLSSSAALPAVAAPMLPTPQSRPHSTHLPLQFTHFFGREEELGVLSRWCVGKPEDPTTHLVTLTGPGGTGKTRLAIEAASRLADAFTGGVWFVPLQDLSDPRLIPATVLDALRLPRLPQVEPLQQVVAFLNGRASSTLLMLDNMEQLLEAERRKAEDGASVVRALLDRCPSLTCLVTSRQSLALEGERELPVPPLPTPGFEPKRYRDTEVSQRASGIPTPGTRHPTPEHLMQFASVQLFVDRAQSNKPDFQVTAGNAAAIAQLCDRLEGIPLALVLAAGRAQVMTSKQMVSELEHRFDFLVSRRRDATERHRTLWAAMEWSYRLLSPELRRFFAGLSVFRGGWTVEAAEAVCEAGASEGMGPGLGLALDYLAQLRECSLVLTEDRGPEIRFRMLETLREYAREQLTEEERAALQRRHADYFLTLAEEAGARWRGLEEAVRLERLSVEHDNLRVAVDWQCAGEGDADAGLRLAGALRHFWRVRGYWSEGRRQYARLLAHPQTQGRTTIRANTLNGAASLALLQGDYAMARALYEESLTIQRELENTGGIVGVIDNLGEVILHQGAALAAQALYAESRTVLEHKGAIAITSMQMGRIAQSMGDFDLARAVYEESLAIFREVNSQRGIATALYNLGGIVSLQGDYQTAESLYNQSLALRRELGNQYEISFSLGALGQLAAVQGDYTLARERLEETLTLRRESGDKLGYNDALQGLTNVAFYQEDYEKARALAEEILTINKELGNQIGIAFTLNRLGNIAREQGDFAAARRLYAESLEIQRTLDNTGGIAWSLETFAILATIQKQQERTVRLRGAADMLRETLDTSPQSDEDEEYVQRNARLRALDTWWATQSRISYDQILADARAALGEEAFAAAWEEGRAMTLEQAIAYALEATGAQTGW